MEAWGGIDVYITGARSGAPALFVFHDIFGIDSGNTKCVCDRLAQRLGFTVVLPQLFVSPRDQMAQPVGEGTFWFRLTALFKIIPLIRRNPWGDVAARTRIVLTELAARHSPPCVAVMGFCWGAWAAWRCTSDTSSASPLLPASPPIVCGVGLHPSLMVEKIVKGGVRPQELARALRAPFVLMPAGNDPADVHAGGVYQKEANAAAAARGAPPLVEVVAFDAMRHGWVNRGDRADAAVVAAGAAAEEAAAEFITRAVAARAAGTPGR